MQPSNDLPGAKQLVTMSLLEITELMIKHHGFHEGLYDLSIEFQIGVGAVAIQPDMALPGAMLGVSRLGLARTSHSGPNTVDAAKINPVQRQAKKSKSVAK